MDYDYDTNPKRINRSYLWDYYKRINKEEKKALCTLCSNVLSYLSSTGNLKTHLKRKHPAAFLQIKEHQERGTKPKLEQDEPVIFEVVENDDSNQSQDVSHLEEYLERDGVKMPKGLSLKRKRNTFSEEEEVDTLNHDTDDEPQAEYVFVKEKPIAREPPKKPMIKIAPKPTYERQRHTVPQQEKRIKIDDRYNRPSVRDQQNEEIEQFGNYVSCLLKQLPKNVCTKVQMEIIELITRAKLKIADDEENREKERKLGSLSQQSIVIDSIDGVPLSQLTTKQIVVLDRSIKPETSGTNRTLVDLAAAVEVQQELEQSSVLEMEQSEVNGDHDETE